MPPSSLAALAAGRHVFCEKPLATTYDRAREVVAAAARHGRALVVDHVLRYNPVLAALVVLRDELLGPVQRFAFENDASDEHLPPDHWFWDEERSGGVFVEHGVHFFDAAHLLLGSRPEHLVAVTAARPDGRTDLVSATARHPGGALATHTHGFTHPDRCERQQMRLDHGPAEVRVEGWIPLRARVDGWTDDHGAAVAGRLPDRTAELMHVPGHRLGPGSGITAVVHRDAGPRGRPRAWPRPHAAAPGRGARRARPRRRQGAGLRRVGAGRPHRPGGRRPRRPPAVGRPRGARRAGGRRGGPPVRRRGPGDPTRHHRYRPCDRPAPTRRRATEVRMTTA